jgi:cyclase
MTNVRVIPRLDIKGPNLVKGIRLEGLRVLGKPEDFALNYYKNGADELLYIDVVASLYERNNLREIVEKTAKKLHIPMTVGGGIRTIKDIKEILRAGADKVAINTAAVKNPKIITEGANAFGSQCIVGSIEAKKKIDGTYEAYIDNGREKTGKDVFEWAKELVDLGAGELLITSVDKEGTGKGYDNELTAKISKSVNVPVIACGGAGKIEDVVDVIKKGKADAVCAASLFHYNYLDSLRKEEGYDEEGNVEFLKTKSQFLKGMITPAGIMDVKSEMTNAGIDCRIDKRANGTKDLVKKNTKLKVVVIDYGLCNLFSIEKALKHIGVYPIITGDEKIIEKADRLILPGVGAFAEAMKNMRDKKLIEPIKKAVEKGTPLLGICLGMQILMDESEEFGKHPGLGLIPGKVIRFKMSEEKNKVKIPQIGWNSINVPENTTWNGSILEKVDPGAFFYFVHSYIVVPENKKNVLATTFYGKDNFCSVVRKNNVFGCQSHPERSGEVGLNIYRQFIFENNEGIKND